VGKRSLCPTTYNAIYRGGARLCLTQGGVPPLPVSDVVLPSVLSSPKPLGGLLSCFLVRDLGAVVEFGSLDTGSGAFAALET
jgi:hypothetical protein